MTTWQPELEEALDGAVRKLRRLRSRRAVAKVVLICGLGFLLLGVLLWQQAVVSFDVVRPIFVTLLLLLFLGGPMAAFLGGRTRRSRGWSAGQIETAHPAFLDRLHTLVHLEATDTGDPVLDAYLRRIAAQASREMLFAEEPLREESRRARRLSILALLTLLLAVAFYARFEPWRFIRSATVMAPPAIEEAMIELFEEPLADAAELGADVDEPTWGEVRITEPGRDLQVTKVDVVALEIEAAASRPLESPAWITTRTGDAPEARPLPPSEEPRYALYQPLLYVDELRLSDWDVVSYHARAEAGGATYASEIYFLEVRPFREDILKATGGEGSESYNLLSELSGLIDRQKEILRQTHRFLAVRDRSTALLVAEGQAKLAAAEADLAEATRHLYARIAAEMENQDIGEVLDHLAAAGEALERAVGALGADPPTALVPEQKALAELVQTRKDFQRVLGESASDSRSEESADLPPVADERDDVRELRDEERAAQDLADVYRQKRRLEEAAERMDEMASREVPGTAQKAKQASRALKELIEGTSAGDAFGPALSEELSDARQAERESRLDALAETGDGEGDGDGAAAAAAAAKESLERLLDAFDASAPKLLRELAAEDNLTPGGREALESALRQLRGLQGRTHGGRSGEGESGEGLAPPRHAERREALDNIRRGLGDLTAGDRVDAERARNLENEAEQTLGRDAELDPAALRRLVDQLERLSADLGLVLETQGDVDLVHIDPNDLPPEYRERIQEYFRRLSER